MSSYGRRGGHRPSASNERQRPQPGLCYKFLKNGRCPFGNKCRYSHDKSASQGQHSRHSQHAQSSQHTGPSQRAPVDRRLMRFKALIDEEGQEHGVGAHSGKGLFSLGLEMVDDAENVGLKQEVIRSFASEEGLACIRFLVSTRIPRAMQRGTDAKYAVWKDHVSPLFALITHDSVLRSALLEDSVVAIFNFVAGVGGNRLPVWFDLVMDLCAAPQPSPEVAASELVRLSLAVMSKLVDCSTSHIVNDNFRDYATRIIAVAASVDVASAQDKFSMLQANQYVQFLQRRLAIGDAIPLATPQSTTLLGEMPSFRHQQDLPGVLSAKGPRHDNDHDNIASISIFPTHQEILSTRGEYLPTQDSSSWHLPGIRGRLDREFRLLREDTIGQLRDVVRAELELFQHEKPGDNTNARTRPHGKDSVRYCTYRDARVVDIDFQRNAGLEFLVEFAQPAQQSQPRNTVTAQPDPESELKSLRQRREWWSHQAKKRLQPGSLVCAIDASGSVLFFVVSRSTARTAIDPPNRAAPHPDTPDGERQRDFTLADDAVSSYVRLIFAGSEDGSQIEGGLLWVFQGEQGPGLSRQQKRRSDFRRLVEFPGVLLDSFIHSLKALQSATQHTNVPFSDLIAREHGVRGSEDGDDGEAAHDTIPPPLYFQQPGFALDLSCLTTDNGRLSHSMLQPLSADEVCKKTKLDDTQSLALLETLSRSVALIQGPPGTGKTFAGVEILRALLHNQKRAKLGPIVVVCYTNHALDQILEHILLAKKSTSIIRMGGQSKSEMLKDLNLRDIGQSAARTRTEKQLLWEETRQLDTVTETLQELSQELRRSSSPKAVAKYLCEYRSNYHAQLFGHNAGPSFYEDGGGDGPDDDGFTLVRPEPNKAILQWLKGSAAGGRARNPATPAEIRAMRERLATTTDANLSQLTTAERHVLHEQWQYQSFRKVANAIQREYRSFLAVKKSWDRAKREVDLRCLMEAHVVGVTTTGLARNISLLKHLDAKVLLCEEAGEVLEAHMLTSLIPSLQHLILIGDHQQLRPQVQNYDLRSDNPRGVQFSFDMSLFERLVSPPCQGNPRLPYSQLATQRRMHPSISALIRAPLYPALEDGPNVADYPPIPGFARRLFWLDHEHREQGASSGDQKADPTSTSRNNPFEIEMVAALVSHLVKQGVYANGDIAVLTPYLGQLMHLQRRLSSVFEVAFNERDKADLEAADLEAADVGDPRQAGVPAKTTLSNCVRIATVDNFQGEEAKVIVVSLVRNNDQRRCGFLGTSNRINVLLSRAKHGMYIIGNRGTCANVPMWQQVIAALEADGNIGPSLQLRCSRHPERAFEASSPDHFLQFSPDGGCLKPCDKRLSCGHSCGARCHSDVIHAVTKCLEPCPRPLKGCTHDCPRRCGEPCVDKCSVRLFGQTLELPCGHVRESPLCYATQDPSSVVCKETVQLTVPGCGHENTVVCGKDVTAKDYACRAACGTALPCGHLCRKRCCSCKARDGVSVVAENHGACDYLCGRPHGTCEHACRTKCHSGTPCPPCAEPCNVRCSHSKCSRPCNEPCVPCAEAKCASRCPHSQCTMPCAAPCNWIPCSQRCADILACGHQCPSVCGEPCPQTKYCQTCATQDVRQQEVDFIMMTTYGETDLDADPCLFPSCGHILTMSSMDGLMDMGKHYVMEETDSGLSRPVSLAASSSPFDLSEAKACPQCRGPLRSVARYGRIVRRAMLDESTKRFITWAHQTHGELVSALMSEKLRLDGSPASASTSKKGKQKAPAQKKWILRAGNRRSVLIKQILASTDMLRYGALIELRDSLSAFARKVEADEQPFQKVADLVRFAQKQRGRLAPSSEQEAAADGLASGGAAPLPEPFVFNETVIQVGSHLQAMLLLLRCDIVALDDVAAVFATASAGDRLHVPIHAAKTSKDGEPSVASGILAVGKAFAEHRFACLLSDCAAAIGAARKAKRARQEAEGHLLYAQLCVSLQKLVTWRLDEAQPTDGVSGAAGPGAGAGDAGGGAGTGPATAAAAGASLLGARSGTMPTVQLRAGLQAEGQAHAAEARALVQQFASAKVLEPELASVEQALLRAEGPFYEPVSTRELQAVYAAMASEFRGSGHWYACVNGHLFTVGECGMPMEAARCTECDAPVGGTDHTPAEGVSHAANMDRLGRDMAQATL